MVPVAPIARKQAAFEDDREGVESELPAGDPAFSALAGGVQGPGDQVEALEGGLVVGESGRGRARLDGSGC